MRHYPCHPRQCYAKRRYCSDLEPVEATVTSTKSKRLFHPNTHQASRQGTLRMSKTAVREWRRAYCPRSKYSLSLTRFLMMARWKVAQSVGIPVSAVCMDGAIQTPPNGVGHPTVLYQLSKLLFRGCSKIQPPSFYYLPRIFMTSSGYKGPPLGYLATFCLKKVGYCNHHF